MKAEITWLVGNMHVWTPNLDVARDIYKRCRRANMPRGVRKKAIGMALKAHKRNRDLVREFRL